MNPTLQVDFWLWLFVSLASGTFIVVLIAAAVQHRLVSAALRRNVWRAGLVCISILAAAEIAGIRHLNVATAQTKTVPTPWQVNTNIPPSLQNKTTIAFPAAHVLFEDTPPPAKNTWWPGLIWLIGGLVVLGAMLFNRFAFFVFSRRRQGGAPEITARMLTLSGQIGLNRSVQLVTLPALFAPVTFGVVSPTIAIPPRFHAQFSSEQRDVILAHELAHIAAHDPLWHLIGDLVCALMWWHPAVWFARRELRATSEMAADSASSLVSNGPETLAACLVQLAERITSEPRSLASLGMVGNGFRSGLGQRVTRLLGLKTLAWKQDQRGARWAVTFAAPVVLALGLIVASGWVFSSEAKAGSIKEAVQRSLLGVALTTAFPAATPGQEAVEWKPWSTSAVVDAVASGRPVLVNFTADWSVTSLVNHDTALEASEVRGKVAELKVVMLRADYTQANAELTGVLKSFGRAGVPLTVVYSPLPGREPEVLPDLLTSKMVLDALDRALVPASPEPAPAIFPPENRALNQVPVLTLDAQQLLNRGFFPEAKAKLLEALRIDPQSDAAKTLLATVQARQQQLQPAPALLTRWFNVDAKALRQGLPNLRASTRPPHERSANVPPENANELLLEDLLFMFSQAGVDHRAQGKGFFFNDRSGNLMVRATAQDLQLIEAALHDLLVPPPQVLLEGRIAELRNDKPEALRLGEQIVVDAITHSSVVEIPLGPSGTIDFGPRHLDVHTGTLPPDAFHRALSALEKREGVTLLNGPRLTMLSGRQGQVKVVKVRYIVTGIETKLKPDGTSETVPVAEPFELGPVVNVFPHAQHDRHSIDVTAAAEWVEFLGYAAPGQPLPKDADKQDLTSLPLTEPLPVFRKRTVETTVRLRDGETAVLFDETERLTKHPKTDAPLPNTPEVADLTRGATNVSRLLVFITAIRVDEFGKRLDGR